MIRFSYHPHIGTMEEKEEEQSKPFIMLEIIDYVADEIVSQDILKKVTGQVTVMSVAKGQGLKEKTIAFDTLIQILSGEAQVAIGGRSNILVKGQAIIVPAHTPYFVRSKEQFKISLTVIKSGYE